MQVHIHSSPRHVFYHGNNSEFLHNTEFGIGLILDIPINPDPILITLETSEEQTCWRAVKQNMSEYRLLQVLMNGLIHYI